MRLLASNAIPFAIAVAAGSFAPSAEADDVSIPVTLTSAGPKAFKVRLADGAVLPCDSKENTLLFEGKLEPGASVRSTSKRGIVCIQQTYDDFPETGWNIGSINNGTECHLGGTAKKPRWICVQRPYIDVALQSKSPANG